MFLMRCVVDAGPPQVGVLDGDRFAVLPVPAMAGLLGLPVSDIRVLTETAELQPVPAGLRILSPIDGRTEVWASGVTYLRSRDARVQESSQRSVYELVYDAVRPELFFKAPAWRVVTDGDPVAIRSDSELNVPEPELALVLNAFGATVGYLICNDMSSRSIEGENPLYVPQAKVYAGACALSGLIRPAWEIDGAALTVVLRIERDGQQVFAEQTSTRRLRRPLAELSRYLFHSENHPDGAVLSTGTGIVPGLEFTLAAGDVVIIDIDGLGSLRNRVVVGREHFLFMNNSSATAPADLGTPA